MFLRTSRLDLEEGGFTFLNEFFSRDEIEAAKEEREDTPDQFELDLICDNEEEGTQEVDDKAQQPVSSNNEPYLSVIETQACRVSKRPRNRPKEKDEQWAYH